MQNHLFIISRWEHESYGDGLFRSADALAACTARNPLGLINVCDGDQLLGYADVWPLTVDFYNELRLGLAFEESLSPTFIVPPLKPAAHFYIGSLITDPLLRRDSPDLARRVFAQLRAELSAYFAGLGVYPATVLGVGSSEKGQSILLRWGFEAVLRSMAALDLRPRYERRLISSKDALVFL